MRRYAVTLTRTITQTATFIVEADSAGEAALKSEDAPWTDATVASSHDNVADEDGWSYETIEEVTGPRRQSVRHRLAAALGYGEQPRPPQHPQ